MQKQNLLSREVFKFKSFCRKGYAVFAVLGREVVIGTLSVVMLQHSDLANAKCTVIDENPTDSLTSYAQDADLDEIEVSGTRAPLSAGQTARIVSVLHARDIQGAAVQSINDLLKLCVGVDVRQRAALGAQTDIGIRGGTSEHTAILLNGICFSDPQTGHNAMDLPVQFSEIERIEILEGPAARVYGAQSLTGAINIITKPKPQSSFDLQAESGCFGYLNTSARGNLKSRNSRWNNQLSGSFTRSDGFNRSTAGHLNNDYEGTRFLWQSTFISKTPVNSPDFSASGFQRLFRCALSLGYTQKSWGSSTSYSVKSDEQFENTEKLFAHLKGEIDAGNFHISPALYFQQNKDRFEFFRGRPDKAAFNNHRTDICGAILNSWLSWKLGRTSAGVEIRNEDWSCPNLGALERTNVSAHLEHNIEIYRFCLSAGFMAVKSTKELYPGIDVSYQIAPHWKLYSSFNTSMRLPTFTDLFYSVNGHRADINLKPEKMTAIEVGTKYHTAFCSMYAALFHNHGSDMIDWIIDTRQGEDAEWKSVNHAKINSYGLELNGKFNLSSILDKQSSLSLGYSYLSQSQSSEPYIQSLYSLEYLRHKIVAAFTVSPTDRLSLNLHYRFQDRIGNYTTAKGETKEYSPYSVVDAKLKWRLRRVSLFSEVNNLLSSRYIDYGNVAQPGISFVAGVKFHM